MANMWHLPGHGRSDQQVFKDTTRTSAIVPSLTRTCVVILYDRHKMNAEARELHLYGQRQRSECIVTPSGEGICNQTMVVIVSNRS